MGKGYIHFYYGNGKGKTTAAMGLALRALGHGMPVWVVQFLKDGSSGECSMLKQSGASVWAGKAAQGFVSSMTPLQKDATRKLHNRLLEEASLFIGQKGLLVLDEAGDALLLGLLDEKKLRNLLDNHTDTEIILTGHQMIPWVAEKADYITEMQAHRHPYQKGQAARPGIEY